MKAILVLNEMPSRCLNCNCVGHINHNGKFNVCRITGEILQEDDYYKSKPDWCPLKLMPSKKPTIGKESENDIICMNAGYNACIDEILGDKE